MNIFINYRLIWKNYQGYKVTKTFTKKEQRWEFNFFSKKLVSAVEEAHCLFNDKKKLCLKNSKDFRAA